MRVVVEPQGGPPEPRCAFERRPSAPCAPRRVHPIPAAAHVAAGAGCGSSRTVAGRLGIGQSTDDVDAVAWCGPARAGADGRREVYVFPEFTTGVGAMFLPCGKLSATI
jgi:hypothetical protein